MSKHPENPAPAVAPLQPDVGDIALRQQPAGNNTPGVLFCSGFHSSMAGIKASRCAEWAAARDLPFTRFDYRGHGDSAGDARQLGIGHWLADTLNVIDRTTGPLVLVGSSMGAWLSILAAERRPERVVGLLAIAAAPDFVTELLYPSLTQQARSAIEAGKLAWRPSHYQDDPWPIPPVLLDSGRQLQVLDKHDLIECEATLIHGTADVDVPLALSRELNTRRFGNAARLIEIDGGNHRLSDTASLATIEVEFDALLRRLQSNRGG